MKKTIFAIALGFVTIFCGCQNKAEQTADNEENKLQTGDLVFVALPLDYMSDTTEMGSAIAASTGDSVGINYIHVAIAEVANDSVWIIDATLKHGVDRHPLDTFLCDLCVSTTTAKPPSSSKMPSNSLAATTTYTSCPTTTSSTAANLSAIRTSTKKANTFSAMLQ